MRGATGVMIQPHQILPLSRRKTIIITYETSFTMRGAKGVTVQPHQILPLSRRKTHILSPHHIWNLIYNARSNWCPPRISPNTAPATKNDTANFQRKCSKTGETSFPMRGRSDHDPRIPTVIREWDRQSATRLATEVTFQAHHEHFSIEKYNVSRPILHSNIHQVLRLPRKVTLELHQVLRLPRKVTLELHQVLHLPGKVTLELHQVLHLPRKVTLELHQVLHLPRKVSLELHQVLHLPRKVTLELHQVLRLSCRKTHLLNHHYIWNLIYNARSNRCHDPTSPNIAPVTQKDSHT